MAVPLTVKKKPPALGMQGALNKAASFGYPSALKPKIPAPVKPTLPAGFKPGMSDADYESYLTGGGAWGAGGYSPTGANSYIDQGAAGRPAPPITAPKKERPDFNSYIAQGIPGDWEVEDAITSMGSQMDALRAAFGGDVRNALVGLGMTGNADVNKEFGSYIDADTITRAAQNKYSSAAQIAQQEKVARANATAAMAARGALRSGGTTSQLTGIAQEGEQGRYQAVQEFLSGARGGLRGLAEAKTGLEGGVARARSAAAARLAQQYGWEFPEEEAAAPAAAAAASAAKPTTATAAKKKPPAPFKSPGSNWGAAATYAKKKK